MTRTDNSKRDRFLAGSEKKLNQTIPQQRNEKAKPASKEPNPKPFAHLATGLWKFNSPINTNLGAVVAGTVAVVVEGRDEDVS